VSSRSPSISHLPPTVTTPSKPRPISRLPRPSPKTTSNSVVAKMSPTSTVISKPTIDHTHSPPRTPQQTTAHPFTSTPPATVKPRSIYAQDILASQAKDQRNGHRPFKRKSIRFSLGITRRPSLFGTGSEDEGADELEDEVDRVCFTSTSHDT
jgi:hypothetical protein